MIDGLITVARWDLKQRLRSRRLLVGWLVWVLALVALAGFIVSISRSDIDYYGADWAAKVGPTVFGLVVLFILAFALVIVPVFSASAIVSERESSTLATLQATTLRPGQIVGGKLLSACAVAGGFMAGGIPALGIAVGVGHINVGRALVCLLVMYVEMVLLCAIALGWSAIATRALVSTVMTYLTVFTLTIITLVLFALLAFSTTTRVTARSWDLSREDLMAYGAELEAYFEAHPVDDGSTAPAPPLERCAWQTYGYTAQGSPERYWWMLLINPFVIVSDAAPLPPEARGDIETYTNSVDFDPLAMITVAVRTARMGGDTPRNSCFTSATRVSPDGRWAYRVTPNRDGSFTVSDSRSYWSSAEADLRTTVVTPRPNNPDAPPVLTLGTPLWPVSLGANLLIATFFIALAVRRVSVPYGPLPKGQRVA